METISRTTPVTLTPIWEWPVDPFDIFAPDGEEIYVFVACYSRRRMRATASGTPGIPEPAEATCTPKKIEARAAATGEVLRERPMTWQGVFGQPILTPEHLVIPCFAEGLLRMTKDFTQSTMLWQVEEGVCNVIRQGEWLYGTCWQQHHPGLLAKISLDTWQVAFTRPAGQIACPATVVNGRVYTSAADLGLSAFDAANGEQIWSCPETGRLSDTGSAAVMNDVLFVPLDNAHARVHQVRATDGHINWSTPIGDGQPHTSVLVWQGAVYCGTTNTLFILDASTGTIQQQLGGLPDIPYPSKIVPWQGYLWLAAGPYVLVIDPVQLVEVTRYVFPGGQVTAFAIVDSTLYVSMRESEDVPCQFLGAYHLP